MTNATMRDLVILWKFHKLLGAAGVLGEHAADRTSGIFHKWHISQVAYFTHTGAAMSHDVVAVDRLTRPADQKHGPMKTRDAAISRSDSHERDESTECRGLMAECGSFARVEVHAVDRLPTQPDRQHGATFARPQHSREHRPRTFRTPPPPLHRRWRPS